jgi:FAD/FMN-containing dehydrogenase
MDEELTKLVKVVTPGHDEWEERRARWNLFSQEAEVRIIVCPKDQDEVITIVNWARKHNQTDIGARAAGHGFFSSAAVVVDMREGFDYASVDEELGVATIGIGQTLGTYGAR